MPRKPQVSRTLTCTKVLALCLDIVSQKPYQQEFVLSRTFATNKATMKALRAAGEDEAHKIVHIIRAETMKRTYTMTEQEFINSAKLKN